MPTIHLHIALIAAVAVLTAGIVYLMLARGRADPHPLRIARTVFLVALLVNSTLYIAYYGVMYSRWGIHATSHDAVSGNAPDPDSKNLIPVETPDDQGK